MTSPSQRLRQWVRDLRWRVNQHPLYWRCVANRAAWLAHRLGPEPLSGAQARVVADLARDGIALTHVGELFEDAALYGELQQAVAALESDRAATAAEGPAPGSLKPYMASLLGEKPLLDPGSVFVRFAISPQIRAIANHYFGMFTRLRSFNVWRNFRSDQPASYSQVWHRDPEDLYILKAYVYLDEVDMGSGPLHYAPGTHGRGQLREIAEGIREEGTGAHRSSDEQMSRVVPSERWVKAVGPPGTVVFADTAGYHKGGLARERARLLYMCAYTSDRARIPEYFQRGLPLDLASQPPSARYALGG